VARRPPHSRPRGLSPLFFPLVVGHGSELRQVGVFVGCFGFGRERGRGVDAGEHNPSSPASARLGEEEEPTVTFQTALFWASSLLLFLTIDETTLFCLKHVVSFKRKWRQNVSISESVLNL